MKDVLWAPWRGVYHARGAESAQSECVFCDKIAISSKYTPDIMKENLVLYKGKRIAVIMNLFPYNNGHLMLIPTRHISDVDQMTDDELRDMGLLLKGSIRILKEVINPHGFNVGFNLGAAAGAGIAGHLHQHIVPRWNGDTNFMPIIGDVKVVSENLDKTFDRLYSRFLSL